MKTFVRRTLVLSGLFSLLLACHEEALQPQQSSTATPNESFVSYKSFRANAIDQGIVDTYEMRDGIIHFKSPQDFRKATKSLDEFIAKFKIEHPDFQSYQNTVNEALQKAEQVKSPQALNQILEEYGDLLKATEEGLKARVVGPLTPLLNKHGIMYIGKVVYFYQDDTEYVIFNGDTKEVDNIKLGKVNPQIVQKFDRGSRSARGRRAAVCLGLSGAFKTFNERWGHGNANPTYQTTWTGTSDPNTGQDLWYDNGYVYSDGFMRKKNFWGNWVSYACDNELNVNYLATAIDGYNNIVVTTSEPNFLVVNYGTNGISNNQQIFFRTVTTVEIGDVYITLEERAGYYRSPELYGASVFYRCP